MIKNFKNWESKFNKVNESYKSIGLGEPKVYSPGIIYEIDDSIIKHLETGEENFIEYIVSEANITTGEIYHSSTDFLISGITKSGNSIYIKQYGEYSKYGGPYEPLMNKPVILINNIDYTDFFIDFFVQSEGMDIDRKTMESRKLFPDFSRLDVYGHLLDKKQSFFTAKKYGL